MRNMKIPNNVMSRRIFLERSALLVAAMGGGAAVGGCSSSAEDGGGSSSTEPTPSGALEIYSPAPPDNPLHKLNLQLLTLFSDEPALASAAMPSLALPESVNRISKMVPERKRSNLPILTTVDFKPARDGNGLEWHRYAEANPDLKFVSRLYDIGFAIQLFGRSETALGPDDVRGKRIAAPARSSSVRMMTETLLRDGWGILDDVTLVDTVPSQIAAARANGEIDGTSWNLVLPQKNGFQTMMPAESDDEPVAFVPVDQEALDGVNAANDFETGLTSLIPDNPSMLSFAQALAVWDDTDPQLVSAMLEAIHGKGASAAGYPKDAAEMANWPSLGRAEVNEAAAEFYDRNEVVLP